MTDRLADHLYSQDRLTVAAAEEALRAAQVGFGPYSRLLGITFAQMTSGHCIAELKLRAHLMNAIGVLHGGIAYALADAACAGAALSVLGTPRIVTQDLHIRYHNAGRFGASAETDLLRAEATVVHHGTRTIVTGCKVTQGARLIASADGTFAILTAEEIDRLAKR